MQILRDSASKSRVWNKALPSARNGSEHVKPTGAFARGLGQSNILLGWGFGQEAS